MIYTSGTGFVDVDEEHFSFAPHDIFLLPPHVLHTDYSENGFKNYHCNYVEKDFPYNAVKKLRDDEKRSLLRVMELMYYEFNLKQKNYKNIIASLYTLLLQYIDTFSEK